VINVVRFVESRRGRRGGDLRERESESERGFDRRKLHRKEFHDL